MDYVRTIRKDLGSQKIILPCAILVIVKDGKILCQKRSDNKRWGLVGGLLELDETFEEAAIREAKEETGLDVKLDYFLGIFHNHDMMWSNGDKAHTIGAFFVASVLSGDLRIDEESLDLQWFDRGNMPELFAIDHIVAIKAYYEGVHYPLLNENSKE